jgi:hypothetical protein
MDDDDIAYLAGDSTAPVAADQRERLDHMRSLLADPAVWAQPDPDLEDLIVAATRVPHRFGRALDARPSPSTFLIFGVTAALLVGGVRPLSSS